MSALSVLIALTYVAQVAGIGLGLCGLWMAVTLATRENDQ